MAIILLDIEGTTTPIDFVYDVLFPFARAELRAYVRAHAREDRFVALFTELQAESQAERAAGFDAPEGPEGAPNEIADAAASFALWQMAHERKATGLKRLQGWIWRQGYESGALQGVVYDDVPDAIQRWRSLGHRVAIYSSGSVEAQQLIFGYSTAGDLRPQLDGYFDTTTGPKKEAHSYVAIAEALGVPPGEIIFCSDNVDELRAAEGAGVQLRLAVRPGNPPVEDTRYRRVTQFSADEFGV